jgi:hypothetical protein
MCEPVAIMLAAESCISVPQTSVSRILWAHNFFRLLYTHDVNKSRKYKKKSIIRTVSVRRTNYSIFCFDNDSNFFILTAAF